MMPISFVVFQRLNKMFYRFLPEDYSLDIKTLQQQQSQDPVLKTVYSWIIHNDKPEH